MNTSEIALKNLTSHYINSDNQIQERQNIDSKPLTRREIDVLHYVIQDYSAKKIAKLLNLSPRTIETYINILKMKLHCKRKGEIILFLLKNDRAFLQNLVEGNITR